MPLLGISTVIQIILLIIVPISKISDLCSELQFLPVLLWRPGKKQHHPLPPPLAHENIEISKRHKTFEKTDQSSNKNPPQASSSSPPHPLPRPQHASSLPTTTHVAASSGAHNKDKEKRETDTKARRSQTEYLSTGKKGHLLVKTTDLTDALPPQRSFESPPLHSENKV